MSTTPFYDNLLATMPDGLERKVYEVVRDYVGKDNAITLPMISLVIFADDTETHKRQVRRAIETLHNEHSVPICSSSGKAGRYMPACRQELDEFILEMRSRASKTNRTADNLTKAGYTWFEMPRAHIPARAEQKSLFEMPKVYA